MAVLQQRNKWRRYNMLAHQLSLACWLQLIDLSQRTLLSITTKTELPCSPPQKWKWSMSLLHTSMRSSCSPSLRLLQQRLQAWGLLAEGWALCQRAHQCQTLVCPIYQDVIAEALTAPQVQWEIVHI